MCWLDVVILLPLLIGLVRGLMRGLITELIAILAVVLGFIGARIWAPLFSNWLLTQFTWPEPVAQGVAYALLFLGIAILLNIAGRLLSRLLRAIHLGFLNRLLGAFFGVAKYGIVILAMVFVVNLLDEQFGFMQEDLKKSSICYPYAVKIANDCLSFVRS